MSQLLGVRQTIVAKFSNCSLWFMGLRCRWSSSNFRPCEWLLGAGLAAKYNFNQKLAFSLGGRYMWFGDAKGSTPDGSIKGDFKDNTGYIVGMKLSYKSK